VLSVVFWKWRNRTAGQVHRTTFQSQHVNIAKRMVGRNTSVPHEIVCVTDDPRGLDKDIRVVPLPEDPWQIEQSPSGENFPVCYRRLRSWDGDWARANLGNRFCQMDLDLVITGNLDHLFTRTEDYLAWGDAELKGVKYSGGWVLMDAGARQQVWDDFHPVESPRITKAWGLVGSDQAWISYCLYPFEAEVGRAEGIYRQRTINADLPENACIVQFCGKTGYEPWTRGNDYPWVLEHYR
jgi:hypothetical protein